MADQHDKENIKTPSPPSIYDEFTRVAPSTSVHATNRTAYALTTAEALVLSRARMTVFVLSPEDILVADKKGEFDKNASLEKLNDILSRFPQITWGHNESMKKSELVEQLHSLAKDPSDAASFALPGSCIIVTNSLKDQRFNTDHFFPLPSSFLNPDKNSDISALVMAHELGHCHDKDIPKIENENNSALRNSMIFAGEVKADNHSRTMLRDLFGFDDQKGLQTFLDVRAINSMIHQSNGENGNDAIRSMSSQIMNGYLDQNSHATNVLLLRPDINPVTALLAPGLANRPINALIGQYYAEIGSHSDEQSKKPDAPNNETERKNEMMFNIGKGIAQNQPLTHYAAAKALLESGYFEPHSVSRLYVQHYVEAMERLVKPDLIADAQVLVKDFGEKLHDKNLPKRNPLIVPVSRLYEEQITNEAIANPENFRPVPPENRANPYRKPDSPGA